MSVSLRNASAVMAPPVGGTWMVNASWNDAISPSARVLLYQMRYGSCAMPARKIRSWLAAMIVPAGGASDSSSPPASGHASFVMSVVSEKLSVCVKLPPATPGSCVR